MKTSLLSIQLVGAGLALLFANACVIVDDPEDGDDEVGDGDGDPTGDGDGDPSGDGDGDQSEQGGDGDGDQGDGDGDQGDGDGDGDPDPAIVEACTQACEAFEACEEPASGCLDACIDHHLGYGDDAECLALEIDLTMCLAGLDCAELEQFMNEDPTPFPCQTEFEASCNGPGGECLIGVGMGENPGECDVSETCGDGPERSIECDGESCTCYVDGVEVGGCSDAVGLCDGDLGSDAIDECCG